ncbi:hypothetical protein [Mobiluncus mulieris]|uniref:Uncharacterized protein n=1 Tax=Mobiluncus mulieris TaxID=2052 RepID=A0A7Y0UV41_9ACTO|nr:hypothetical protein [Mobiluncus mulieris]NMX04292.1 hypothetical protein [Mobiluncus mulieris]NMX10451.1 hypothetical protein [Mobiluncus mulieris]
MSVGISSVGGAAGVTLSELRADRDASPVSPMAPGFTKPIEDSVSISHVAEVQNDMINGLKYWAKQENVQFNPENLEDTIKNLQGKSKLTEDDVKVIAVAYGFAQRKGYSTHVVDIFWSNLYSYRDTFGPHTWLAGNHHPSRETVNFDVKVLGSTAFDTTLVPKDFLINGFDTKSTIFEGEQAKFTADVMRHLSACPDEDFNGTPAKAMMMLQPHQDWVFNNFIKPTLPL